MPQSSCLNWREAKAKAPPVSGRRFQISLTLVSLPRTWRRLRQKAFTLRALAGQLTGAAHSFGAFTRTLFRRLLVMVTTLHFAESAFPLHLLFERLQRLVDVVVANENLYQGKSPVTRNQYQRDR